MPQSLPPMIDSLQYFDYYTRHVTAPKALNSAAARCQAVRWEARDELPALTTSEDIVRRIRLTRASQKDRAAIDITNRAIEEEYRHDRVYRDNLRRFLEIAYVSLVEIEADPNPPRLFGRSFDDIFESLHHLESLVHSTKVSGIPDKSEVFVSLKRHWRWLGNWSAMPFEPLFEFVTGKQLRLE